MQNLLEQGEVGALAHDPLAGILSDINFPKNIFLPDV